jgi:transcription initiation factor TFIIH subunit 4
LISAPLLSESKSSFFTDLYSDSGFCLFLFSKLSKIEIHVIFKILFINRQISQKLISHFLTQNLTPTSGLSVLIDLQILSVTPAGGDMSYDLHAGFRESLIRGIKTLEDPLPGKISARSGFSDTKWHSLLERVISSMTDSASHYDIDVVIRRLGFGVSPTPPAAYKFVLSDVTGQLWTLIFEFIQLIEIIQIPQFLKILISILRHRGGPFPLPSECPRFLSLFESLDLIRPDPLSGGLYSLGPTAEALNRVAASRGMLSRDLLLGAKLVVDSNLHVTAYTQSGLQVKLVSLFCQVQRVIGSVVAGVLTRESVQRAIESGVSAQSIISFLSSNLHPDCGESIPVNVANQIRLWEADCPKNRLKMTPCTSFNFPATRTDETNQSLVSLKQYAEANSSLLFLKQDKDGRIAVGVKAEAGREFIRLSRQISR